MPEYFFKLEYLLTARESILVCALRQREKEEGHTDDTKKGKAT